MPKSAASFDRITIAAPCNADWEAMPGNDQVRFCEHCHLHVTNLSSLTWLQAMRLVEQSRGRLCVRYEQRAAGDILTNQLPPQLHQISRRVTRFAAAAFSATLSVASAAAQNQSDTRTTAPRQALSISPAGAMDKEPGTISGVIKDPQGALVPKATVTLTNDRASASFVYVTQDDGAYKFSLLEAGAYDLSVDAPGFSVVERKNLELPARSSKTVDVDVTLPIITVEVEVRTEVQVEARATMGVVAVREPANPLAKAAAKDDLNAVKELIPVTDDIDAWDKYTNTNALAYAIENHNREMIRLLLSAGATVNSASNYGRTPLMYLTEGATTELVHDLISAGADINAEDESNSSVLANVIGRSSGAVVKQLIDAGARLDNRDAEGNTVLMRAADNDDPLVVKLLLTAGVDVAAENKYHDGALAVAARSGQSQNLKALLDAGARFNLPEGELANVFMQTVTTDDPAVVRLMLAAGASSNARGDNGITPLMSAAKDGKPETVKILIEAGADINAADEDGTTALMKTTDIENVRILLDAGADIYARNKDGKTALALAIENKQDEIVKLLKSRGAPE
jgi:ankyrin repeat protein